ncbi:hypothetical protein M514_10661 [Trichuris suis]|uniref:HTH CENPB-type domain-containing protein n=1 Tax=Trichuris suis TaxID=68888 RepID=A0A085MY08_9BILA|nr:hypothetical protein M514_10661 [Trichuris suis]
MHVSGPTIQEVARRFALEFGLTGFQASSGWLEKFKLRHKISQKILCGESNEVTFEALKDFIAKFRYFASGFKEEDIFNADECGLFFKAMPDRSLALKGGKCKSRKLSKERFTVLLCAIEAIGDCGSRQLSEPSPREAPHKRHVDIPASKTQLLDQGVIKTFKAKYRTQLLQWVIRKAEVTSSSVGVTSIPESMNALDAVLWISSCWNKAQSEAIRKCFRRAGFVRDQEDDVEL